MHVDEAGVMSRLTGSTPYQASSQLTLNLSDTPIPSYNPSGFHTQPLLGTAPQSSVGTENADFGNLSSQAFNPVFTNSTGCHSSNDFSACGTALPHSTQNSATFITTTDQCNQSQVPHPFYNTSANQLSGRSAMASELPGQVGHCQANDFKNSSQCTLQQEALPHPIAAHHACPSGQTIPYQSNFHTSSPPNSGQNHQASTSIPVSLPAITHGHLLTCHDSHMPSPSFQLSQVDHTHLLHGPVSGLAYSSDVIPEGVRDQVPSCFLTGMESDMSGQADQQQQPQAFLSSSVNVPTTQTHDQSTFLGMRSDCDPYMSTMNSSVCEVIGSHSTTNCSIMQSSSQEQISDTNKTAADVTIMDPLVQSDSHLPSQAQVLNGTLSQMNKELARGATLPHANPILNTGAYQLGGVGSKDSDALSVSDIFPGTNQAVADINSPFKSNNQNESIAAAVCGESTGSQFNSSSFTLPTSQVVSESYPQPMQVQDSDPHVAFPYCTSTTSEGHIANAETAMDVSTGLGGKSDIRSTRMSFEEIHMSIIRAGDELSRDNSSIKMIDHADYGGFRSLGGDIDSSRNLSHTQLILPGVQAEICDINSSVTNVISQTSAQATPAPQPIFHQSGFGDKVSGYPISASNSATASDIAPNLLSGVVNNIPVCAPCDQHVAQNQASDQGISTIPNFLDSPESVIGRDHLCSPLSSADMRQDQSGIMAGSALAGLSVGSVGMGMDCSQLVDKPNMDVTSSQQSGMESMATDGTQNPQLFVPDEPQTSSSSFFVQPGSALTVQTGNTSGGLPAAQIYPSSHACGPPFGIASGTLQTDSGAPTLPHTSGSSNKFGAHMQASLKPNFTGGSTPGISTLPSPGSSRNQSHLSMSLEELQKLLAQENLSRPSPSIPQQQPYTSWALPQTLTLQKHASHSLRQNQPRLQLKGQAQTHVMHQQVHQNREKVHETELSDLPPDMAVPQRTQGYGLVSDSQQKNPFQFLSVRQQPQQKLHLPQQTVEQKPKMQLHVKPAQQQPQTGLSHFHQLPKSGDQRAVSLQLLGSQKQFVPMAGRGSFSNHKPSIQADPWPGLVHSAKHSSQNAGEKASKSQQEFLVHRKEKERELEDLSLQHQHMQPVDKTDRPCNDSHRNEYRHLHNLLTGEATTSQTSDHQDQSSLQLPGSGTLGSTTIVSTAATSAAPFTFLPVNNNTTFPLTNSSPPQSSMTLSFIKNSTSAAYKSLSTNDHKLDQGAFSEQSFESSFKSENDDSDKNESKSAGNIGHNLILSQTLTERNRSHSPLSVDLNSPASSHSDVASPLSSPTVCEDGGTQQTLIERSAGLDIKSDTFPSEGTDDENANFDLCAFHKRPSTEELYTASTREKSDSVPMKIAKPSADVDARSSINHLPSPEPTFDFGGAAASTANFSFSFGNKDDNSSEVFTFGSSAITDPLQSKDGSKPDRLGVSKPVMKATGIRCAVPTQTVRPTARKQKEYSLKAYYPSKLDNMELKILEQPESQHRARYQTEGSRGAIKDANQQGFPVIKLFGYTKPTKLQVFIGDECGRVKPHGFYQACRVFGKNSTTCTESEIEGTTVIEIEMLPENDMTVRLDCVGILKLRNADVERRIGPKRAREKKKANIRARLVMRCLIDKSDWSQQVLQVVSNPIVCTQPAGQPEICRMSLSESSVDGGDSLFIIGKNFKNKGTNVLFQKLDSGGESVLWQAEAEIEQEFFQPTHLICKIPPYKDKALEQPEIAQIVVSCAGKRSDPQTFTYKPVHSTAPSMKQETHMDTDSFSAQKLPFVSPEALQLNRMVHTQSVASTGNVFQLPSGTILSLDKATVKSQSTTVSSTPTAVSVTAPSVTSGSSSKPVQSLTSFLLDEKSAASVSRSSHSPFVARVLPASVNDSSSVDSCAASSLERSTVSPDNNEDRLQPPVSSAAGGSTSGVQDSLSTPPMRTSQPLFLVVDPSALQASAGVHHLLQQILEAQGKA